MARWRRMTRNSLSFIGSMDKLSVFLAVPGSLSISIRVLAFLLSLLWMVGVTGRRTCSKCGFFTLTFVREMC
jgi:hypothetical protein